jgi:hypothetical protein
MQTASLTASHASQASSAQAVQHLRTPVARGPSQNLEASPHAGRVPRAHSNQAAMPQGAECVPPAHSVPRASPLGFLARLAPGQPQRASGPRTNVRPAPPVAHAAQGAHLQLHARPAALPGPIAAPNARRATRERIRRSMAKWCAWYARSVISVRAAPQLPSRVRAARSGSTVDLQAHRSVNLSLRGIGRQRGLPPQQSAQRVASTAPALRLTRSTAGASQSLSQQGPRLQHEPSPSRRSSNSAL